MSKIWFQDEDNILKPLNDEFKTQELFAMETEYKTTQAFLAENKTTKEKSILKFVKMHKDSNEEIIRTRNEFKIGKQLADKCNEIVKPMKIKEREEGDTKIIQIQFEHSGEILSKYIGKIKDNEILGLLIKTIKPLVVLEQNNVFHSSIKPDNYVIEGNMIKLNDFGEAKQKRNIWKLTTLIDNMHGFTPRFCPPEIFLDKEKVYLNKIDVFCWGMTIYQILFNKTDEELYTEMVTYRTPGKKYDEFFKIWEDLPIKSGSLKTLVFDTLKLALAYDSAARPGFASIAARLIEYEKENHIMCDRLIEKDQGQVSKKIKEQNVEIQNLRKEIDDFKSSFIEIGKEMEITKKQLVKKNEELENKNEEIENKNKELENKNKEFKNKSEELENKDEELKNKSEELEETKEKLKSLKEENSNNKNELKAKISEKDKLKEELDARDEEINKLRDNEEKRKKEIKDKTKELVELNSKLENKEKEIQELKKALKEKSN